MKTRSIGFLTVAHASADINQGAIPVLLPFFIAAHHLTYAAAAGIVFGVNLVSTVFQPIFGCISDRWSKPWLIPLSMLVIGLGVSFAGFAPTYRIGVASVMISGLGIAAFHPEGARLMNYLAGDRKATAMSLFGIGGQLGFAIGPLIATAALFWWGIKGTACLIVPPAVMAGLFLYMLPRLTVGYGTQAVARPRTTGAESRDRWPAFICLAMALLNRSVIFYGLNTFLPLFWIHVLHQSAARGGSALTVFLVALIAGNFLGGRSADRLGLRAVTITGFLLLSAFLPLLLVTSNPLAATLLLVPIGLVLGAVWPHGGARAILPARTGWVSPRESPWASPSPLAD